MTYTATAKRWSKGWEIHIDGIGVTQSHSLDDAPQMAREYIACELDIADEDVDSIDVTVTPEPDAS